MEGVGILIWDDGNKYYGEYHQNKLHGIARCEYAGGDSYWGEMKNNLKYGYGTMYLA